MSGSDRTVVIAGASVAGVRCATAVRDAGFAGAVMLLDAEDTVPYDKPQLSKRLEADDPLELLIDEEALRERRIDFRPGVAATGLDLGTRVLETSRGPVAFDELVVATGCRPRPLRQALPPRAGYLRTRRDWERLTGAVRPGGRLIVIGAGFLGLEAAAAATRLGMQATVVDVAGQVLTRAIPERAAALIAARHVAAGAELRLGVEPPVLDGDDNLVWADGVKGDYALVAVGAVPNVEWLAGSGLSLENGVVCDAGLAAAPGVWAIGDCARWINARYGRPERSEHWTAAVRHALHVATSIASGAPSALSEVPYAWSDQLGWKIQVVGHSSGRQVHYASGSGAQVVVSSTEDGQVSGVTTINAPGLSLKVRQLLRDADPCLDELVGSLGLASLALVA